MNISLVSSPISTLHSDVFMSEIYIKGETVTLLLTGIEEPSYRYKVAHTIIDWGDGSEIEKRSNTVNKNYFTDNIIIDEILFGKYNSICVSESHTYSHTVSTTFHKLSCQILLIATSGASKRFVIPITTIYESYYDGIGELSLRGTQVLPVSTNDTYVNLVTKNASDVLMGVLR